MSLGTKLIIYFPSFTEEALQHERGLFKGHSKLLKQLLYLKMWDITVCNIILLHRMHNIIAIHMHNDVQQLDNYCSDATLSLTWY